MINYVENVRKAHEQIIDTVNPDKVKFAGWDKDSKESATEIIRGFKSFLEEHKDEITALRIYYNQPYRRRELTFTMLKEVLDILKSNKPNLAPLRIWHAYEKIGKVNGRSPKHELTALVSLIRHVTGIDEILTPYNKTVDNKFKEWVFRKNAGPKQFTNEQMEWLRMIKEHIISSFHIDDEDLDYAPFDAKGGIGKMYQIFGDEMDEIINELNEVLAA